MKTLKSDLTPAQCVSKKVWSHAFDRVVTDDAMFIELRTMTRGKLLSKEGGHNLINSLINEI